MYSSRLSGTFVAVVACALLFSFDASAQVYAPIESLYAPGRCLDVPAGSRDNKVEVQLYSCNGGDNQQWAFIQTDSYYGWGMIRNLYSGKCLDVRGALTGGGVVVQQYTCGTGDNQLFRRHLFSNLLQVKHSGLCIGALGTSNHAKIRQGYCRYNNSPSEPYSPAAQWSAYFSYSGIDSP
ncbi:RICIN domain-containing protein [Pyxidicoccus sp. 3LFB2]